MNKNPHGVELWVHLRLQLAQMPSGSSSHRAETIPSIRLLNDEPQRVAARSGNWSRRQIASHPSERVLSSLRITQEKLRPRSYLWGKEIISRPPPGFLALRSHFPPSLRGRLYCANGLRSPSEFSRQSKDLNLSWFDSRAVLPPCS